MASRTLLVADLEHNMNSTVKKYLAEIGRKGGKKSRRVITQEQQAKMQQARREKR